MLDRVAAAFKRQDYDTAAQLLQQLLKDAPLDPWVQFYWGQLQEVSGNLEVAADVYQQLLRSTSNRQILSQARQGLLRLEVIEATDEPSNPQMGVLVLEPIANEAKTIAAQKLAQLVHIDAYTARLLLPSRGWRLYRIGESEDLRCLGLNLHNIGIPCFWITTAEIEKIQVFQVNYFQSSTTQTTVVCRNAQGQLGSLTFNWSEVTQRVIGSLPIFEQVVDVDVRGKLKRKTQTQDYVQMCDLHLPGRSCILRLCDRTYQFQHGMMLSKQESQPSSQMTARLNWNHLLSFLDQQPSRERIWSDFTTFAETALEQITKLGPIQSHIHLFRRNETNWDPAFHLYSGLAFLKGEN